MKKFLIVIFLLLSVSAFAQTDSGLYYYKGAGSRLHKLAYPNDSTLFLNGLGTWQPVSGGGGGGLVNWVDSTSTTSPNDTTNTSIFFAKDTSANADAVIMPKGTGALLTSNPNGTTTGGNKRGQYAVDFQRIRSSSNQVASGNRTFIGGGNANRVSAQYSSIVNGSENVISDQYGFIGGGQQNAINYGSFAAESAIGAGDHNVINGQHSFIGAGNNNTINAGQFNGSASFIGGGQNNSIQGTDCAILGGNTNTMNTFNSVQSSILGGASNNIQGFNYSAIVGGSNNSMINGGVYNTIAGGEFLRFDGTSSNFGFKVGSNLMTISRNKLSVFGNTDLWLANNDNQARALMLFAPYNTSGAFDSATVHYVGFKAGAVTSSVIWKLPVADATVAGQALTSDGAGTLSWATASGGTNASYQATPSNPTGTASTTGVMMGLAGSITPTNSGKVLIIISGDCRNSATFANSVDTIQIHYGTGSAPANGDAITGTGAGASQANGAVANTNVEAGWSLNAVVTGLTVSTAYWIDVSLKAGNGTSTPTIGRISISVIELP